MYNKFSISNILLGLSVIFTILGYSYPLLFKFGMNNMFLDDGNYFNFIIQVIIFQFIHGGFLHLLSNGIFIYVFGNGLERLIGENKFLYFYLFSNIFIAASILLFTNGNTVGISGFCMALLAYYTLYLKSIDSMEYKGGITALIINIGIGFTPGISLVGHLFGGIAGVIFFYIAGKKAKINS